ncbi:MAG: hypothetical protein KDA77_18705 [Planctomycetaceae bacterium]|nr:hypothetical protein [Planctomycetaceae bacterium]
MLVNNSRLSSDSICAEMTGVRLANTFRLATDSLPEFLRILREMCPCLNARSQFLINIFYPTLGLISVKKNHGSPRIMAELHDEITQFDSNKYPAWLM